MVGKYLISELDFQPLSIFSNCKKNDFIFSSMYMHGFVQVNAFAQVGQRRELDLLELELQVVVSCMIWVLGTELWASEKKKYLLLMTKSNFLLKQ